MRKVIVREFETGLLYRNGRFKKRLGPGCFHIYRLRSEVVVVDTRVRMVTVPGQEVLSSDNVGVKISIALSYTVDTPDKAIHSVQDYEQALYVGVQLALRTIVAENNIDEMLAQRFEIGKKLVSEMTSQAEAIGLKLHTVEVKDVMFPGDLKKIFAEVVKAQKEGQAALERARGETAALRNLANAAKMMENNPALMNLRVLQTIAGSSGSSGNTFVLGIPQGVVPVKRQDSDR